MRQVEQTEAQQKPEIQMGQAKSSLHQLNRMDQLGQPTEPWTREWMRVAVSHWVSEIVVMQKNLTDTLSKRW